MRTESYAPAMTFLWPEPVGLSLRQRAGGEVASDFRAKSRCNEAGAADFEALSKDGAFCNSATLFRSGGEYATLPMRPMGESALDRRAARSELGRL